MRVASTLPRFHASTLPRFHASTLMVATVAFAGLGCTESIEFPDPVGFETDGVATVVDDGGNDGADEGADTTGAEPELGYCLSKENPEAEGFKFQCLAEYELEVNAFLEPSVGSDGPLGPLGGFVNTAIDSTYDDPIAMACCSEVDDWPMDSCELEPHHAACFADVLAHVCISAGKLVEAEAAGLVPLGGKVAVEGAGKEMRERVNECMDHFWRGGDETCDPGDLCAADLCEVAHDSFEDLPQWQVGGPNFEVSSGDSVVSNMTVDLHVVVPDNAVQEPPDPPATCDSSEENDSVPPPTEPPGTVGSFLAPVADVPIDVVGPEFESEVIAGSGEFSQTSSLHRYFASGKLAIDEWSMVEAAPTTVGTSSIRADVDGFQLWLMHEELFPLVGSYYTLGAGLVAFHLGATIDGQTGAVIATNKDKLSFYQVAGGVGSCPTSVATCLVNRPFTLGYEDEWGGVWELDVPTTTWRP